MNRNIKNVDYKYKMGTSNLIIDEDFIIIIFSIWFGFFQNEAKKQ